MIEPTEEMLEAARAAGAVEAEQEFWAEVAERLNEYQPEIKPRPVVSERLDEYQSEIKPRPVAE